MPIKPVKLGTAGAVGIAQVGTLYLDETQGWDEPFQRSSDYPGLIGFGVGLVTQGLDIFEEGTPEEQASDALVCASEPMLIRSIYEAVKHYVAAPAGKEGGGKSQGKWKLIKRGQKQGTPQPPMARTRYV